MTFSVTKSFVSTVVGLAFDRGLIKSLRDAAGDYSAPVSVYQPNQKFDDADLRDAEENSLETMGEKADRVLREAGLISSVKFPNAKKLSDEERRRIGKLFSGEKPLGDYIDEDREARG